jgi:hypothetical protein
MKKSFIFLSTALCLSLSACGATGSSGITGGVTPVVTQTNYASIVAMIQTNYPAIRASAEGYINSPSANPAVAKDLTTSIATIDPLFASLSPTSPVATIQLVLTDVESLVLNPNTSNISNNTKTDINDALTFLQVVGPLIAPLL